MRIASIDIGTNTVLLLVADVDDRGIIHPVAHEQRLPRLGKEVDEKSIINTSAFENIAEILRTYREISKRCGASTIAVCATSAVRDAANKDDFLSFLKKTTGMDVEILNGNDEAQWTYRGAISGFPELTHNAVVIDIGGGSTEVSFPKSGSHNGIPRLNRYSLQLGAVRLKERYFKNDPPLHLEIQSAINYILEELSQILNPGFDEYQLIGVAGTITTLACLDQHLIDFDLEKVSGYNIDQQRAVGWSQKLCRMNSQDIRSLSNATEGRADILTAGMLILSEFMKLYRFQSLLVSERGLRYGIILREWEKIKRR